MTSTTATREIRALTGLRAVAASWVVLHHFGPYLRKAWPWLEPAKEFIVTGIIGVDLFFVLSGFIISYTYEARHIGSSVRAYFRFLWARLCRIYPVHLVTLLIVYLLYQAYGAQRGVINYSTFSFFENLFLVHAWKYPASMSWNFAAWSVSSEWAAYVLAPVFFFVARRLSPAPLAVAGIVASGLALIALYASEIPAIQRYGLFAIPRLLAGFMSGCLIHQLYKNGIAENARWEKLSFLALGSVLLFACIPMKANKLIFAPWLFAVLIYTLTWQRGALARFFSHRVMHYLGQVSYSLYLVHSVIWWFWKERDVPVGNGWAILLVVGTLLASMAMYHLVEVPARRRLRRVANLDDRWTEARQSP